MKALTPPVDMQRFKLRDVRERHDKRKLDEFALLSSILTFSYLQILKDTALKVLKQYSIEVSKVLTATVTSLHQRC